MRFAHGKTAINNEKSMDKKTIKREGKKAIKIVKESEKRQGIIGYKIYVADKNSYLKFSREPSISAIEYTENFDDAHVFKSRIDALPIMVGLTCEFELKAITKIDF